MNEATTDIIVARSRDVDRLSTMVLWSVVAHVVVTAIVMSSAACVLNVTPFLASASSPTDTTNELTIATISDHALTRHQNQRTR